MTSSTAFAALGVPPQVDAGLAAAGFTAPFAIQTEAIPVALTGVDLCGRARTGSGKTLAFGVPMLARMDAANGPCAPRGLVLVPTRELALQVAEVLAPIGATCDRRVLAVYGGASREDQITALKAGVELVVATPLRLIDLLKEDELTLADVQVVVIDEADRMADEGFMPQVEWVLRKVTSPHQTMLFSATLDGQVGNLVRRYMNDPREVSIDAPTATVGTMRHLFLAVHRMDKDRVVAALAAGAGKTVVFCDTKRLCDKVAESLQGLKVKASALHGDMTQAAREKSLAKFAEGSLNVLVATDVAARGIDIDDVAAVVHYEPPIDVKTYLHRSGRTARAGRDGWAVTLAEYNQHTTCRIIQRGLRLEPQPPIEVFSNDKRLAELSLFLAPVNA
ncbi:MAG: DEAD/DEAH box helicase [Actinobacteria bacterium]|nr:DEAD/DEAH box helicase [Actinomycetota bacterium]NBR76146.1 DEAD/DEAH box helicase [Actinomycetota bacterium]NBR92088.1 DEAD/DEAH box helicase [Actinomycetota bacterium]NCY09362.1 DEAD/DEAH box helicase [Actinomycetota bacterium]NDC46320.1 DEAD/DEAH box helicase [Actinomycetota bacterium]